MTSEVAVFRAVQALRQLLRAGDVTDGEIISVCRKHGIPFDDVGRVRSMARRAEAAATRAKAYLEAEPVAEPSTAPQADAHLEALIAQELRAFMAVRPST